MGTILVVAEVAGGAIREASYELLTVAHGLGGDVKGLVIGSGVGDLASQFASKGAGETYVVDSGDLAHYNVDGFNAAIRAAVDAMRAAGCGDDEILEANLVVAYFAYANRIADGLGIRLEPHAGGAPD